MDRVNLAEGTSTYRVKAVSDLAESPAATVKAQIVEPTPPPDGPTATPTPTSTAGPDGSVTPTATAGPEGSATPGASATPTATGTGGTGGQSSVFLPLVARGVAGGW